MPCIFLENIRTGKVFNPEACEQLYHDIADAVGIPAEDAEKHIEVHVASTQLYLLRPDGSQDYKHGVHGRVEMFASRTLEQRTKIAKAIHEFLIKHGLGKGSDIKFDEYEAESFFFEGKLVPGGPPREK